MIGADDRLFAEDLLPGATFDLGSRSIVAEDIIEFLLGHYLNVVVHVVLLNAKASEQSARMVSMKNATDNADALIKELTLAYNKLRQGHITQELLEIAGGQAG